MSSACCNEPAPSVDRLEDGWQARCLRCGWSAGTFPSPDSARRFAHRRVFRRAIVEIVSQHSAAARIPIREIRGKNNARHVVAVRHEAMALCCAVGHSRSAVAKWFSRDHATVLYALAKVRPDLLRKGTRRPSQSVVRKGSRIVKTHVARFLGRYGFSTRYIANALSISEEDAQKMVTRPRELAERKQ